MFEPARRKFSRLGRVPLVLSVLLGGCFVPLSYDVSLPRQMPPGTAGEIHDETIRLELPNLNLSTQVQSYEWDGQYLIEPLGVWLELEGLSGRFALDARSVTLASDGGEALQPVSFLGPAESWHSPRAFAAGCGPRRYHSGIAISNIGVSQESVMEAREEAGIFRPSVGPVAFEGKKCFMLWYDTDPLPDHSFVLSINGVRRDGEPVAVPEIQFEKGSVTTVRGIP